MTVYSMTCCGMAQSVSPVVVSPVVAAGTARVSFGLQLELAQCMSAAVPVCLLVGFYMTWIAI